ncbi:substrate-binding periplasmic protein [Leptonema illini]|uniref:substrate-binding periplasmic protein n=1 Tax=Leptonema illini TaxID=183 RepID=UPI0009910B59|nr:transporter substrate-binding domain-containing protein [Leptonema illini]
MLRHSFLISAVFFGFFSSSQLLSAPEPGSSLRLKRIVQTGVIKIGLQKIQPLYLEEESRPGIDVELAHRIAADLGVKAEIVIGTPEELIERVTKGTIDLSLGGLSSTVNRGLQVRFTGPYILVTPAGLLNRLKIPEESASIDFPKRQINSLRDIQIPGKLVVGVRAGSTNEQILKADAKFSTFHIETFATNLDILTALDKNQIDLLVADDIWIRSALKNRPDIVSRFQPILGPYSEEHLSIAVPPGDAEYWMLIDFMVKEYRRTGVITQILERYIDVTRDVR